jgi:hypothetical protein
MMAHRFTLLIMALLLTASCGDDGQRRVAIERDRKKKEQVFANIDRAWHFDTRPANPTAASLASTWNEYRELLTELSQKPKRSIEAFRKKSQVLSQKMRNMRAHIPAGFDKPEVRARLSVVSTKINELNLYLNQDEIDDKKVIGLIADANATLGSLQVQMGEITRKNQIPREQGEPDIVRMRDTARAIPDKPSPQPAQIQPSTRLQEIKNRQR